MRHSHDDTQARSLGHGDPDTSMAANVQAKQDDPSTAMRANRIDTTEDYVWSNGGQKIHSMKRQTTTLPKADDRTTYEW